MEFLEWYNETHRMVIEAKKYPSDINLMIYSVLGIKRTSLVADNYHIVDEELSRLNDIREQYLSTDIPIAYIVGFELFLDNYIKVNEHTLIPRFETAELVLYAKEKIDSTFPKGSKISIADVCTGSGVIAVSLYNLLKKDYTIELILSDISEEALEVAKQNLLHHDINSYQIYRSDLLTELVNDVQVDVLISNPPYIAYADDQVEDTVINYEPHIALYADDNGLECYMRIIDDIERVVKPKNLIFFEIGATQAQDIQKYGKIKLGKNFDVVKDISQRDRILCMDNYDN